MSEVVGVPVVVVTKKDDHVEAINTALRDAGHAAHCIQVEKLAELEAAITQKKAELVTVFAAADPASLKSVIDICTAVGPQIPVLLVTNDVNEDSITAAMDMGARDVVSLKNIKRLQNVATRELRACRLENALASVMDSANQYKHELNSLKQISVEAIADIQEGIIVNANPAWLEMFGRDPESDLTGHPIMDLCAPPDRPALKGALVACQRGKWRDSKLTVKGLKENQTDFPVAFSMEVVEHDGEPAVRMLVAADHVEGKTPVSLVEQAIQRDQLTGLYNRSHFINMAQQRLEIAPAGGVRAIAYIRPDRFSRARDDIGLNGTESAISHLAQILREFMQPADIYGRFGGTMFVVMLERGTMTDVEAWGEQLLHNISEAVFEHEEKSTAITCSIGMCEIDSAASDMNNLLNDAERACRSGRKQGGNKITLSESSGAAKKVRQDDSIWVPRIRGALMENRLHLEHQPIASLNDEIEAAYDTLVRMLDEEGNTILPSEFMPVAERTGLTKNIDRWGIGASISFCMSNNAQLVFIRLSRDSILDKTLPDWLNTQIDDTGVTPEKICFEVSEEIAVQHFRQTQSLAESLQQKGFKFALEHFGKSDHPNRIFSKIPMGFVKIDGSLMQGLHKNSNLQNEVKELARLAREHNILTIAERVQDANTMAVLWQLGISYIQGNYVQNHEIVIEDTSVSSVTTLALTVPAEAEV
ncbi:MAG: EAL domain-containing protein [Xanthomonadales bacterium]|nr:EAL domain-containing protein [Xanthomonadales bacterium]